MAIRRARKRPQLRALRSRRGRKRETPPGFVSRRPCLEAAAVAALFDGTASVDERAATMAHLIVCEACHVRFVRSSPVREGGSGQPPHACPAPRPLP
ncbi:MAG TPA: hypothetical protein VHB47_18785 [Thermoanaerobaculia bacterium]|nr:hypothetical protein [Thermoanaerobaculia bacterium]